MTDIEGILKSVQSGKLKIEDAQQQLTQLQNTASSSKQITYKVSAKGAISFYGIRSRPITLYNGELETILNIVNGADFKEFIRTNESHLSKKFKK